jgi:Zn-dependent protease
MQSQFGPSEFLQILIAWIVLSVGITYRYLVDFLNGVPGSSDFVVAGFIATATGFILHEMGHKYVAVSRGYVAHFRIWTWGLLLTIAIVAFSRGGFVFGAPGAVYIAPAAIAFTYGSARHDPERENMIISAAGPAINLAFAVVFLTLFLFATPNTFISIVSLFGFSLNVGLGSFNMIPIPPLDGSKIFRKSILVGLALAVPLWIMFLYFFSI